MCFRREDLLLIIFQLLGDIALGIHQCLLANPSLRHLIAVGIAHFQIVAKDIVITYLQTTNTRVLNLALLQLQEVVLTILLNITQLVQLRMYATGKDIRASLHCWWVGNNLALNALTYFFAQRQLLTEQVQICIVYCPLTDVFDRFDSQQRMAQLHHLAGCDTPRRNLANHTLHIVNTLQVLTNNFALLRVTEKVFHHRLAVAYRAHLFERKGHPTMEQTSAHRSNRTVNNIVERGAILSLSAQQL